MQFNLKEVNPPAFKQPIKLRMKQELKNRNHQKLIVVGSSGKGGTGKTTAAVNLALYYHESGYKTVLLDFDTPHGDVATMLGINDDRCLTSWLDIQRPLSPDYANNMLMETKNGLKVLPSIRNAREDKLADSSKLAQVILESMKHFDIVIVDAAPHFSELTLEAYRQATKILMVSDQSNVSLTNIYRGMKHLREQRIDTSNSTLMVNRVMKKQKDINTKYTRTTTITDVIEVAFEPKMQEWAGQQIFPLVDKLNSKYARQLVEWADEIAPNLFEGVKKRKGFFRRKA
ncbi:MAG: AAA family ATPase [Bacillota bacterium]|nr:AAA family ATPase [Bacillota bacterium]